MMVYKSSDWVSLDVVLLEIMMVTIISTDYKLLLMILVVTNKVCYTPEATVSIGND